MADDKPTKLERASEWGYRIDTVGDLWDWSKPWVKPLVAPVLTGIATAFLRYREHVALSQVVLFGLFGAGSGLLLVVGAVMAKRTGVLPFPFKKRHDAQIEVSKPRNLIEEGRQKDNLLQIRTHVVNIVQRFLMPSHDAVNDALRACIGAIPPRERLARELAQSYECLIADASKLVGEANVAANRSLQDAPEETKPKTDVLVANLVVALNFHFRLHRLLEGISAVPVVMLKRSELVTLAGNAVERLRGELRATAQADGFHGIKSLGGNLVSAVIPANAPKVVASRIGRPSDKSWPHLFVRNIGGPARGVDLLPIQFGAQSVNFQGAEIGMLQEKDGDRSCQMIVENFPNSLTDDLPGAIRRWQREQGGGAEFAQLVGQIKFADFNGHVYLTFYRIAIDVLDADGLTVEFLEQRAT